MFLKQPLQNLGLTEKEAKVYLANLELGVESVQNIAKKAGIKRPTAYLVIKDLNNKGLIIEKPSYRGNKYFALDPENLRKMMKEKEKSLNEVMPFLRAIFDVEKNKPTVRLYEGVEAVKQAYQEAVMQCRSEIRFFSSIQKLYEILPNLFEKWINDVANQSQFKIKDLINPDKLDLKYAKSAIKNNTLHEVRVLPKNFPYKFENTDFAILENKVFIVSFDKELFATVIESTGVAKSLIALFELAWIGSDKINSTRL